MNSPQVLTASIPRLLVLSAALLAAFAIAAAAAAPSAQAGSGGVSAGSGGSSPGGGEQGNTSAKYRRLWDGFSRRDKRWAHRTAECESGGDPDAIGGGGRYRGAFQFMKSTWRSSPKSPGGDPIRYTYKTQAVVAVKLKKRDGAGHWPVCG